MEGSGFLYGEVPLKGERGESMVQHSFERYEKKYLLFAEQYRNLREAAGERLLPERFGGNTILSVYYDTPDFRPIRASMDKPIYKEKLRMISYGVPQ